MAKAAVEEWFQHLSLGGSVKSATVEEACRDYVEELKTENSEAASVDAAGCFRRLVYGDSIAPTVKINSQLPVKLNTSLLCRETNLIASACCGSFNRSSRS